MIYRFYIGIIYVLYIFNLFVIHGRTLFDLRSFYGSTTEIHRTQHTGARSFIIRSTYEGYWVGLCRGLAGG